MNVERIRYRPGNPSPTYERLRSTGFTHTTGADAAVEQWTLSRVVVLSGFNADISLQRVPAAHNKVNFIMFPARLTVNGFVLSSRYAAEQDLVAAANHALDDLEVTSHILAYAHDAYPPPLSPHPRNATAAALLRWVGSLLTAAHVFTLSDPATRNVAYAILTADYAGTFPELLALVERTLQPASAHPQPSEC